MACVDGIESGVDAVESGADAVESGADTVESRVEVVEPLVHAGESSRGVRHHSEHCRRSSARRQVRRE